MRFFRRSVLLLVWSLSLCCGSPAQGLLVDNFDELSAWKPIVSDGVSLAIRSAPGVVGPSMALDFAFHGGAGYAIAQKAISLTLPKNYRFSFYLRGKTPVNNFEFKLLDSLGNVFWIKKLNVTYPRDWKKITVKKRHLVFAWGPSGGGELKRVTKIEFAVSAGNGGEGTVFIDEFRFERLPDSTASAGPPLVTYSSLRPGTKPQLDLRGDSLYCWASGHRRTHEWLAVDFLNEHELGGLVIDWDRNDYAKGYSVQYSDDGKHWLDGYTVINGNGGRDYIPLTEVSARYLRLTFRISSRARGYVIRKIEFKPPEFSETPNTLFTAIAADMRHGLYPKYFAGQQTYWTVVGASGDTKEALMDETGAIELERGSFRLEPFLFVDGQLLTRIDGTLQQSLDHGYLPIPSVDWMCRGLRLSTRAFAVAEEKRSLLVVTYRLKNERTTRLKAALFVAARPFQVLPPWQNLNIVGGVSPIDSMREDGRVLRVNGDKEIFPISAPDGFGATGFDQGDITDYLARDDLPSSANIRDHAGYCSGAYRFDVNVLPDREQEFSFVIPFHAGPHYSFPTMTPVQATSFVERLLENTRAFWESKLAGIDIRLPGSGSALINILKSNLAYIFINRDGPAIQPGSRTYKRAWMRDGSLTSTALLQTGNSAEVREYLDWYARYQYPNGKIPCVVDRRGADPVPENDSHGEFIYAVMQYFRFTHDTLWLRRKLENVVKAARYMRDLRGERKTDTFRTGTPEQRACYGLIPESISHEGYSARPMHSYWDDFFVLRGLKDAAEMAHVLQEQQIEKEFSEARDDFQSCLYASMKLAMANTKVDYIPGCVELGDFDATSTAIGIIPCGELGNIPEPQLHRTFDKYYEFFRARRDGEQEWTNYTPYEVRIIGAYVLLGQRARAHELLDFFLQDQRPPAWNHWAEVVWRDRTMPRMIGDMPHTWVGSDFIRSVRSMFVYERERDTSLLIGAGIRPEWVMDPMGMEARHLPTYYGDLDFSASTKGRSVMYRLGGTIDAQAVKVLLVPPIAGRILAVHMNGQEVANVPEGPVEVGRLPATIEFAY
jgi:hypothetical protein